MEILLFQGDSPYSWKYSLIEGEVRPANRKGEVGRIFRRIRGKRGPARGGPVRLPRRSGPGPPVESRNPGSRSKSGARFRTPGSSVNRGSGPTAQAGLRPQASAMISSSGTRCRAGMRAFDRLIRPVGELLDPVADSEGQFFSAGGAEIFLFSGFLRREDDAAFPVAVGVILSLLRDKIRRCKESWRDRGFRIASATPSIAEIRVEGVGFAAEFRRGMGVGVRNHGETVQGRNAPDHPRVGGKAGFEGGDERTSCPRNNPRRNRIPIGSRKAKTRASRYGRE